MDKISILCITQLIEGFNSNDATKLFDLVQETSQWLAKSVHSIAELTSFNEVQKSFERLTSGDDDAIKILIDPKK